MPASGLLVLMLVGCAASPVKKGAPKPARLRPVALEGLVARLSGPARLSPSKSATLTLEITNKSSEPRVLATNQTVIQPRAGARAQRQIVLSFSAGPRAGVGMLPDRFDLSIGVPAGANDLYLQPGRSATLPLSFHAGRLSTQFERYRVQAIYFAPADARRQGGSHLVSNEIELRLGR